MIAYAPRYCPRWLYLTMQFSSTIKSSSFPAPNYEGLLLSLLLRHQFQMRPTSQVHAQILTTGLHRNRCILLWNTLLRYYSQGESPQEAIFLYKQMVSSCGSSPFPDDTYSYSYLLKACANMSGIIEGSLVHGVAEKKGYDSHVYVRTALINMYMECGSIGDAIKVFDNMSERNLVTWNVVITGLGKWGEIERARSLFDMMPKRNVVSWTGMVDGYTRAMRPMEALVLFRQMQAAGVAPTEVTLLAVVPAISSLRALVMAELVHGYGKKKGLDVADVRISNTFVDMYAKCGNIMSTFGVFSEMGSMRNLVSWTSIISGYAMHGFADDALRMFEKMEESGFKPNEVTFLCLLNACSHGGLVEEGMQFFSAMSDKHGIKPGVKHYGCIVDLLGRAGRLRDAERVLLDSTIETNSVLWRTLLGCCHMHGDVEMGERVVGRIVELEKGYGGDYVLLSNILVTVGRYGDAEGVRKAVDGRNISKLRGHSLF